MTGLTGVDWAIVAAYCVFVLALGVWAQRREAGKDTEHYFLSGRNLPWWIAGASMAASAFSIDTPLYVTNLTRTHGVHGNWEWWYFGVSGVLGATIMARYWRRAGVMTDLELITLRYTGRAAHVLRGFRAVFFGLLVNPLGMAAVIVAAIKVLGVVEPSLVDASGWPEGRGVLLIGGVVAVAVVYSVLSGFTGVVLTDLAQFVISMVGAGIMAFCAVRAVGGLEALTTHPAVAPKLAFVPAVTAEGGGLSDGFSRMAIFLGVSWWTFVNADGGGKYVQRMASCRDERESERATWFATITFVALRSWPWILVGLAGLVLFPQAVDPERVYPDVMLSLGPGLTGLVFASLIAAFMSTVDTQLNWGASYLVNDLLKPYLLPGRSERFYVWAARLCAVPTLAVVLLFFALDPSGQQGASSKVLQATKYLRGVILVSSGLGAVYLLRWFWWRLTAWGEVAAMVAAPLAAWTCKRHELDFAPSTLFVTAAAVGAAVGVSLLLPHDGTAREHLAAFVERVRPAGLWGPLRRPGARGSGALLLVRFVAGNLVLFGLTFAIGGLLLGKGPGVVLLNAGLLAAGVALDARARVWLAADGAEAA